MEPSDRDILLGRFKRSFNHPGNLRFRALINESVELYMHAYTRREKGVVIKGLYKRLISKGCRFLKQCGKLWVDVSDDPISRDKISHAIRDAVSTHFKNGILSNEWESTQQESLTSKIKNEKRDEANNVRKATAMTQMKKIPFTSLDEAQELEQLRFLPVVLQERKDERRCDPDHFPFSTLLIAPCPTSQYMDQCDGTHRFSSSLFSDAVTVTVANSIGISLPSFHDVEYNPFDSTKNECLCSSALDKPSFIQDQNPNTGSVLSMYDILRTASDMCSDVDDFHMEAFETWEDKIADSSKPLKLFSGSNGLLSQNDEFGAYFIQ